MSLWSYAPAFTLALVLPVMARVAREDHSGQFLLAGFLITIPTLLAAVLHRPSRRLSLSVALLVLGVAATGEFLVSLGLPHLTF